MVDASKPFIAWRSNGWCRPSQAGYDSRLVLVLPLYLQAVRMDGLALSAWFVCPFCGRVQRKLVLRLGANQASCKNKECRSCWTRDGYAHLWSYSDAALRYFRKSGERMPTHVWEAEKHLYGAKGYQEGTRKAEEWVLPTVVATNIPPEDVNTLGERERANIATVPTRDGDGWSTVVNRKKYSFTDETCAWHWLLNHLARKGYGSRGAKET